MTALNDIRDHAELLGWSRTYATDTDTFVRSDKMVTVCYNRDGTVHCGHRYRFYSVSHVHLQDQTRNTGKKADVICWLSEG
jgi:hypothetical protein